MNFQLFAQSLTISEVNFLRDPSQSNALPFQAPDELAKPPQIEFSRDTKNGKAILSFQLKDHRIVTRGLMIKLIENTLI